MPFTSTSPPNSNPFGHANGFAPPTPAPLAPGGVATALPGYPVAAAPVYSAEPISPDHRLGRGDHLSFRVQEDRDDKVTPLIVTDSGEVDFPLIGRIRAAGKTTTQLTSEVKAALEREYYYHATVIMGLDAVAPEASRGRVYVSGAVRSGAGPVEIPPGATLTASEAIIEKGGPTDFGNLKNVHVLRKGAPKKGIPVNVAAVLQGQSDKDLVLEPNDTVEVPEDKIHITF